MRRSFERWLFSFLAKLLELLMRQAWIRAPRTSDPCCSWYRRLPFARWSLSRRRVDYTPLSYERVRPTLGRKWKCIPQSSRYDFFFFAPPMWADRTRIHHTLCVSKPAARSTRESDDRRKSSQNAKKKTLAEDFTGIAARNFHRR